MTTLFSVVLMMAQVPATVPPAPDHPVKVKKQKPKQVCETVEVTGTRVPQRICHNADDPPPVEQDIRDSMVGLGTIDKINPPVVLPK